MLKKTILYSIIALAFLFSLQTISPTFAIGDNNKCANLKQQYGESSTQYQTCLDTNSGSGSPQEPNVSGSIFTGRQGDACQGFLGLTAWDCGVTIKGNEDSLKKGIWQIVANIATDITVIAAYLVLGYVIYGGYLYIFSSGDPNKVTSGKKTLTHAFIGLAIVMSSYLIMTTIRFALLGAGGKFNCDLLSAEGTGCVNANDLVTNAIQWVIGIAGAVALIFVVYGGISYTTSAGDPSKLQKAKQTILYALIGLAIVALAEFITAFVSNLIRNAENTSGYTSQTIISKESHEINKI
jgi:hypothetical protein